MSLDSAGTLGELFDACKQRKALEEFEESGYAILRKVIPKESIDAAVRLIYKDLFDLGISSREIVWWRDDACWFPHLRWHYEIHQLARYIPTEYRQGEACDPQILLAPPDEPKQYELTPHIDEPPKWATNGYESIVGIPLTPHNREQGGVQIWPFDDEPFIPRLEPGDCIVLHSKLPHCGVPNLQGGVRMAVYFRFLEPLIDELSTGS